MKSALLKLARLIARAAIREELQAEVVTTDSEGRVSSSTDEGPAVDRVTDVATVHATKVDNAETQSVVRSRRES